MEKERASLASAFVVVYAIVYALVVFFGLLYCGVTYTGFEAVVAAVKSPAFVLAFALFVSAGTALVITRSPKRVSVLALMTFAVAWPLGRLLPDSLLSSLAEQGMFTVLGIAACWIPVAWVLTQRKPQASRAKPVLVATAVSVVGLVSIAAQSLAHSSLQVAVVNTFLAAHGSTLRYALAWLLAAWLLQLVVRRFSVLPAETV